MASAKGVSVPSGIGHTPGIGVLFPADRVWGSVVSFPVGWLETDFGVFGRPQNAPFLPI